MGQQCAHTKSARWRLLFLLACAVLAGCQPSGHHTYLHSYVTVLAEYLAAAPPIPALPAIPPPPSSNELQLSVPASSLEGLDFLSLSGCALQATIIKRNSSLGRTAKASQRLLLALEFLQLAPACIQQLHTRANAALANRLEIAWQEHQSQLPALVFNATLGSDEYRAFWLSDRARADYPPSEPGAATTALRSINSEVHRWLNGDYRAQNRSFELLLTDVAGGDGGKQSPALSQQSDARALHRYRTELKFITGLERQLAAVLPPSYRAWQQQRVAMIANAAHRISQPSERRLQRHNTQNLSSSPNVEEIGYTATRTAISRPIAQE